MTRILTTNGWVNVIESFDDICDSLYAQTNTNWINLTTASHETKIVLNKTHIIEIHKDQ